MVKVQELQRQLNKNNQLLQTLLSTLTGPPIRETGNGRPSTLQTALATALGSAEGGDFGNLASHKVFHGTGTH
jgi:hypothetical protein